MAENRNIEVGGRLHSIATGNVLAGANEVLDDAKGKKQSVINSEVSEELNLHTNRLNGLSSQNYVTVEATPQTTVITDVLPATGAVDTVYRVGKWDGSQYRATVYSEYAWNVTQYKLLDVKEYGIDDEPTAGSDNLVKSGGVAETLGIFIEDSIPGNGSSWRTKAYSSYVIKAGEPIKLTLTGPITFAGTSETQTFLRVYLLKVGTTSLLKDLYLIRGENSFADTEILYTPSEDCFLAIEGRWQTSENLNIGLCKNLFPQVAINTKDINKLRGGALVVHASDIDFDNTNHRVVLSSVILANPTDDTRLSIAATNIDYDFASSTTTAYWFTYNFGLGAYRFVSAGKNTTDDIIIACLLIAGNSSATPNSSVVKKIYWCAINNCSIDGKGYQSETELCGNIIKPYIKEISLLSIIRGTLYNGAFTRDYSTLANTDFIPVYGGTKIECIHANDIPIRVTQYSSNQQTSFIKQSDWAKFESLILEKNTRYIRIAASYSERGFSQNNPVSYSNYQEGDFGVRVYRSEEFKKVEFIPERPIDKYGVKPYFVDGNKWKTGENSDGKSTFYRSRIISVQGKHTIVCKANNSIPTRIAFLNTFDEEYILSHFDSVVDGTSNQNTLAGQTRTYVIPNTCNYICLNTLYNNIDSEPISLVIDGVEYYKDLKGTIDYLGKTLSEVSDIDFVLGRTGNAIAEFTVNKGTIWEGKAYDDYSCLYDEEYIDVVGGDTLNMIFANYVSLRLTEYDINKSYLRGSTSYAQFKTRKLGNDTRYVRISAAYNDATYTEENPITPEHFQEGDFGFTYSKSEVIKRLNYTENNVNRLSQEVKEVSLANIFGRNHEQDTAIRATGQKAISTDILPFSFIHISDIHTKKSNSVCFENACEFYEKYSNIAAMILTGDIVWDTYADQTTWYDTALAKTSKPVLNVIGNHDAGQYQSSIGLDSQSSDLECYNKFIAPYVNAGTLPNGVTVPGWGVVQPANAATNGNSYYYKDFSDEKVRLIVLCEFETEYEINQEQTGLVYSREYRAMRQAQVTWLINTLANTPNDYGVIIAMHQPPSLLGSADNDFVSFDLVNNNAVYNVYSADKDWLAKIINAYATKSTLTLSVTQTGAVVQNDATLNCNCDFSSVQSEFICVVCGHTHRDYIGHLADYPAVSILCVGADNLQYTSKFCPRVAGTKSEDLFNVVNIDRNRKTIKIIRIGSDASVTGQVRDQMIMSYATT